MSSRTGNARLHILRYAPELRSIRDILPRLHKLLRGAECVLLSANLVPPLGWEAMRDQVLPLYDNEPTRVWLVTFLHDLGVDTDKGEVTFSVQEDETEPELLRITADFKFTKGCEIVLNENAEARFGAGDRIRLFKSYRYTLGQLQTTLLRHGFSLQKTWITKERDESILLIDRSDSMSDHQ